jgi:hypothetical protein
LKHPPVSQQKRLFLPQATRPGAAGLTPKSRLCDQCLPSLPPPSSTIVHPQPSSSTIVPSTIILNCSPRSVPLSLFHPVTLFYLSGHGLTPTGISVLHSPSVSQVPTTFLTTITLICIWWTVAEIKRNLAALDGQNEQWPPMKQMEEKSRPSFATEDVDVLRDGTSCTPCSRLSRILLEITCWIKSRYYWLS